MEDKAGEGREVDFIVNFLFDVMKAQRKKKPMLSEEARRGETLFHSIRVRKSVGDNSKKRAAGKKTQSGGGRDGKKSGSERRPTSSACALGLLI